MNVHLIDEQKEWFFEMESALGEGCGNDDKGFRILHKLRR